jgi:probable F420-dependent oxidoreductase
MPHIAFTIPGTTADASADTPVEFARRAEAVGAHSVWVTERLMDRTPDAFVTLGAIAATTSRVKIGTCVLLGVLRPPLLVAKAVATIDSLSGGRFILGLGVGSRAEDFDAAGVPIKQRGGRMDELLALLEVAWSGQAVKFQGRYHSYDLGPMRSQPVQKPRPPVWFGGGADAVLRRTARVGDGFIASSSSGPDGFRARWQQIQQYAREAGRDPTSITPAALVNFSVSTDGEHARDAMGEHLTRSFNAARAQQLGPMSGTPDEVVRGAREYFDAGVELLICQSISADLAHLELFCESVVPRLDVA